MSYRVVEKRMGLALMTLLMSSAATLAHSYKKYIVPYTQTRKGILSIGRDALMIAVVTVASAELGFRIYNCRSIADLL